MKAVLILISAMISIQYGASMAKGLFGVLTPEAVTSARITMAALILSLLFKPWRLKLSKKEKIYIVGYGVALGFMNLTFYKALKYAPLGIVVAIEFLGPLAISFLYSKKAFDFVWALLAGVGIYMILPQHGSQNVELVGIFYALLAALCWALYIVFGKGVGKNQNPMQITSLGMIISSLATFFFGVFDTGLVFTDSTIFVKCLLVALFSSAIPYSLEMISLKNIPAKTFGILMSLEPAVAMIIGIIFLKEYLSNGQYLGIGLVIFASMGSSILNIHKN